MDSQFDASTTDSFLNHCGEKEKLLVTSNFSFSHNVLILNQTIVSHLSVFTIAYLDLLLNLKLPKTAYQVKG